MKRAVFGFTRPPGQKPDALASMGCLGGWIVMPEATRDIGVDDRKPFSIFYRTADWSDLNELCVGAIDMNHLARI